MNVLNSQSERRPRVLSLGNDASLLRSRQFVLEGAGFTVVNNIDVEHTVPDFDYAVNACVLCQSIALKQRLDLAATIRERIPQAGVVFIHYGQELFDATNVDALVRTPAQPDDLVSAVRRAMKKAEAR
jgi:hypothetical protein